MIIFEGQNAQEFYARFNSVDSCREYLSEIKWKKGFICVKCSHSRFQVRAITVVPVTSVAIRNPLQQIHFSIK